MEKIIKFVKLADSWIAIAAIGVILVIIFGFVTMKGNFKVKPLVYLIPPDFIGPVFVFFGQKDGIDVVPDPLGNAVMVPRNGVVKLRGTVDSLISDDRTARNLYWVSVSKSGQRKILWIINALAKDRDGEWIYSYFDESGIPHFAKGATPTGYLAHIPENKRNDRMVMAHDTCKHQRFASPDAPDSLTPDCGKFLIASPNETRKMPDWLWFDINHEYKSIRDFEVEAEERALKIEALYKSRSPILQEK